MLPNYKNAFEAAYNAVLDYSTKTIPIDLGKTVGMIKNLRLCSFSEISRIKKLTLDDVTDFLGSDLGAITRCQGHYIIYYNDTKNNIYLDRFTIAHELGHFFLDHLNFDGTLQKEGIDNDTYNALEKEANCFARNFLSPVLLFDNAIPKNIDPKKRLEATRRYFAISDEAAKTRMDFYDFDQQMLTEHYRDNWDNFTYTDWRQCKKCGHTSLSKGFCEICGADISRKANYVHPNALLDSTIKIYHSPKTINCPSCGKPCHISAHFNTCTRCGTPLENMCLNEKNAHSSPIYLDNASARYCPSCGSPTTYKKFGILDSFKLDTPSTMDWVDFYTGRQNYLHESGQSNALKHVTLNYLGGYKWAP